MGGNDDALFAIAGDGTKTSLFVFNFAFARDPFVGVGVVGADTCATVAEIVIGSHGVGEVHLTIGPNEGPGAGGSVRLPVVGRVVQFTAFEIDTGHVGMALHVGQCFHSGRLFHGGDSYVFRRHGSHLRVAGNGHQQDEA